MSAAFNAEGRSTGVSFDPKLSREKAEGPQKQSQKARGVLREAKSSIGFKRTLDMREARDCRHPRSAWRLIPLRKRELSESRGCCQLTVL